MTYIDNLVAAGAQVLSLPADDEHYCYNILTNTDSTFSVLENISYENSVITHEDSTITYSITGNVTVNGFPKSVTVEPGYHYRCIGVANIEKAGQHYCSFCGIPLQVGDEINFDLKTSADERVVEMNRMLDSYDTTVEVELAFESAKVTAISAVDQFMLPGELSVNNNVPYYDKFTKGL